MSSLLAYSRTRSSMDGVGRSLRPIAIHVENENDDIARLRHRLHTLKAKQLGQHVAPQPRLKRWPISRRALRQFGIRDYSLTIILLLVSIIFGFNLALQLGYQQGRNEVTPSLQVAGAFEEDSSSNNQKGQSIEDFERWMDTFYTDIGSDDTQTGKPTTITQSTETLTVKKMFNTSSLQDINRTSYANISFEDQIASYQRKTEVIQLARRIDSYIKQFRSYEEFDNQLPTPVNGLTYIAVSEETGMPLKFLLAIARAESRFGTDRFTRSGNLTRPGEHRNICSIGLDDSGNNITFRTWEEGLLACGKWYQRFEARGVPDCRKWRIFNPNGDYCAKITTLSNEIETYITK